MTHQSNVTRLAVATLAALFCGSGVAPAQDLHPSRRPSPMGMARIEVGGTHLRVVYSRPYKRKRDNIFGTEEAGALVPFGQVWRTGANEATEVTFTGDVRIAGKVVPAGTYSLFTTPGPDEWAFHLNRALGLWGDGRITEVDGKRNFEPVDLAPTELLRTTVKAKKLEEEVDQLTLAFEPRDGGADLVLTWITTEVRLPIDVPKAAAAH